MTQSAFVRSRVMDSLPERSNGESAGFYFRQRIGEDALYLLDEPENSLSPQGQMELADYLEETVRYMGCQLVISTHSPYLLAMKGAKIYDLDARPADIKRWTQLAGVRAGYEFYRRHSAEFEAREEE